VALVVLNLLASIALTGEASDYFGRQLSRFMRCMSHPSLGPFAAAIGLSC
jgi:hypothetical protein